MCLHTGIKKHTHKASVLGLSAELFGLNKERRQAEKENDKVRLDDIARERKQWFVHVGSVP